MSLRTAVLIASCCSIAASGRAHAQESVCAPPHTLERALSCAIQRSPELRASNLRTRAAETRTELAGALLPSAPELSATLSRRWAGDEAALNWTVELSQRVDVAGQRAARIAVADAESEAARQRAHWALVELSTAVRSSWLEYVAARKRVEVEERAVDGAHALLASVEARAKEELLSLLDADTARAEAIRVAATRDLARAQLRRAGNRLALLIGAEPLVPDDAQLDTPSPAASVGAPEVAAARADVRTADALARAGDARASLERRNRVPSPALVGFAEEDGFGEHVIGGGIRVPLWAPEAIAPNGSAAARSAELDAKAAAEEAEDLRRRARTEARTALDTLAQAQETAARFDPALIERASRHLAQLREALAQGQVSVRDAVFAQRTLLELESGAIDAALELSLARVEVDRAFGVSPSLQVSR